MSLGAIIGRDVLVQKMQDHLSRAACREGLWGDSEGRAQVERGRKGARPMLQPECRWLWGSFSSSFPASFPAPAPTRYRSLLDAFEGAALKRANVASSCFPQEMKGASLVVSWLRTHLAMQGTLAWSLVQEDPTCHGATMPMCHNYQAQAPPPEKPSQWEAHALWLEKAHMQQWRPREAKNVNK